MITVTDPDVVTTIEPDDLLWIAEEDFLCAWRRITGQPPAVLLPRAVMVEILVETWPGFWPARQARPSIGSLPWGRT